MGDIQAAAAVAEATKPSEETFQQALAYLGNGKKDYWVRKTLKITQGQLEWIRHKAWEERGVSIDFEDLPPLPLDLSLKPLKIRFGR